MQSRLEIVCNMKVPWAMFLQPNEICNVRMCNSKLCQALEVYFISSALWTSEKFSTLDAKLQKLTKHLLMDRPCIANLHSLTHLQSLTFGDTFNSLVHVPPTLEKLCFGSLFNQSFRDFGLPLNLQELELGVGYVCHLQDGLLPTKLRKLTLRGRFDQRVDFLPPSLKELYLDGSLILVYKPFSSHITQLSFSPDLAREYACESCIFFSNHTRTVNSSDIRSMCVYVDSFNRDQIRAESLHAMLVPHLH
jgi:hypothetical protein